nr:hypothetical protein [Tanacetum cinerariifolium]
MCELACQIIQKKQEEKRIEEEQAANARYWKIPACCDDDDDDDSGITPILSTEEPIDSLKTAEIVILEVKEIKDDNLREKLLNVHLLIANIEALKDNPTQSSAFLTKSSSTSLNSFLEETNTFHNSLLEFENFYFDLGEISSGSTTTHCDISLPDYEAFYFDDDHIKEISSGSTTTHSDIYLSKYDSFIFDLTHEEFIDELTHIISLPEYDRFYFKDLPDPGELMSVLNSGIRENLLSTTSVFYSFKPGSSHRHGAFKKFNTHRSHLNEWPMKINGKNTPILDVLLFHFHPLDQVKYGGNWVKLSDLKQALRGRHLMLISSLIFLFSS